MTRAAAQLLGLLLCAYSGLGVSLCLYMLATLPLSHALGWSVIVLFQIALTMVGTLTAIAYLHPDEPEPQRCEVM